MFLSTPKPAKIYAESKTQGMSLEMESLSLGFDTNAVTPTLVRDYLLSRGWIACDHHPDTSEELFTNPNMTETDGGLYKWEQAVAFEMFVFMNLGPS
jgi:hypothetical protein